MVYKGPANSIYFNRHNSTNPRRLLNPTNDHLQITERKDLIGLNHYHKASLV